MDALSARQLRRRNLLALGAALVGLAGLSWDFARAVALEVPVTGWTGFVAGPICQHKLSEVIIASGWMFFAVMSNHTRARQWPAWMPEERYRRLLRALSVAMTIAVIPATYAWTTLNLGTSVLTTNVSPRQDSLWVWRGYLGVLIAAAVAFPWCASRQARGQASWVRAHGPEGPTS